MCTGEDSDSRGSGVPVAHAQRLALRDHLARARSAAGETDALRSTAAAVSAPYEPCAEDYTIP